MQVERLGMVVRGGMPSRINKAQVKRIFYYSKWPSRKFCWEGRASWTYWKSGARKYLRKNYCYPIECPTANFLAAFMWRRPLNNATLTTTTHRKSKNVSDETSTQVVAQIINKCKIKIVQIELYNRRDPPWIGDQKL